ncbi:mediator complex subunit 13 C-terminal-domain-containing protein [Annulohypoxylon maeteangense]|uniref:mediator complex subunit 13 C-terminal-domain-containing protein n=1 Tax=Annulohypoxylon maeteangense TaxID=1927788 RepID=UPI00200723E6|nr:mediator complex subunit 13 C-terminal-domain-containing protein [Annulohypoxylon maeteangense]KAI0888347.1 mediator complex subunit 13 C-terminal-domain-containing protein [Annulohypoxylon maeteangense]
MIDTIYDMDTGEYETNALVINNISFVNFAFYDPVSPTLASFGSNALDLENGLRRDGFLAYFDTVRRGVWCFRLSQKDRQSAAPTFPKSVGSAGFTFSLTEEGALEPAALVKNRQYGPNAGNTPASSSSSSASAGLDSAYRNTQSATLPPVQPFQPFPTLSEQEPKIAPYVDSKLASSTSIKDIYEHFILAALSAISSSFCATTGAIPLSSRILLLPRSSHSDCIDTPAILASLRIYLTTTGSLVISFALSPAEGIINLSENMGHTLPSLGVTVLAAPLGMFATCHPIASSDTAATDSGFAQSPDTQVMRLRSERDDGPWRNVCAKFLQARNIPSSFCESQNWIGLQRMRRKPTEQNIDGKRTPLIGAPSISWPVNLCFCKIFSRLTIGGETEDQSASQSDRNFDPLKAAKQWVLSAGERDESLAKNKKERDAVTAREVSMADGQAQHASRLSPLTLQRPNNANALPGGLYPTPPGAQNIIGATPSMDGTASSPGNNATATTMTDVDAIRAMPYNDGWEHTEVKRERIGTSFETENLFGELGPDMFGDADITEADFNFFDEQPGDMGLGSLDLPGLSGTDPSLDLTVSLPSTQESQTKLGPPSIHLPDTTPSPTFTKPELRHARSSLEDPRRLAGLESNKFQPPSLKRPASPFNPDTVYKRIRASLDNHKAVQKNSRISASPHSSIFDKVNFGPCLSIVNSKYEGSGRFDYSLERSGDAKSPSLNEPPTTDYLRRHVKGRKGLKELPAKVGQILIRASGAQVPVSNGASPSNIPSNTEDVHSDADEISLVSDQDDSSYDGDEPLSPIKSVSMRRRLVDDDGESLATSFRELESVDVSSPHEFPQTCKSEADLPLTKYFADPEPPLFQYSLPDDQLIIAAQILTDQFATCTLPANAASQPFGLKVDRRRQLTSLTRRSIQDIKSSLPPCLAVATECQFRPFIELQDVPLLGQPTRMQPRPPNADQMRPSNLFQIPSPHFELRRYESKLSVLPSAVAFWESLGLSPSPGNKDINAICIFPDYEGLADDMLVFTDRMRSIYESLKLGSFNRLPTTSGIENGLFSFAVEKDPIPFNKSSPSLRPSLANCASKVCQVLASMNVEEINFVVFFVYSPEVTSSIVESCAVFNQVFENYRRLLSTKKLPIVNDLALQLVPQDFVASSNSVAMPSPFEFSKLAIETYDRCIQFGGTSPSPALMLEQPPPRMIDFKLTTSPSASLLHENACLHIAYAQSIDGRWITAAWTDNRGSQQMTASYGLGRKGKNLSRPIGDAARGIWEATLDFISAWKVHWRVIIAKCGAMEQSEIELWSALAQAESKISLTLIAVDTDPSMQLLPPIVKVSSSALSVFYTTPVSTPQGSMVSPEQSGNPPTPIRENMGTSAPTPGADNNPESDGDSTLTEITDQTWGAVLSHRLNNSSSLMELNPALVSGYLVKRGGSRAEDPLVVMEVSIVHTEGHIRAYESLLREMLTYYRGLGTLARARGMVDKETDIRPWHIAAAEKAVKALYMLM